MAGALAFVGILLFLGIHIASTIRFRQALDAEMAHWSTEYNLTDHQIARIRKMEEKFHGNGSPFTSPIHNAEEIRRHKLSLSRIVSPESAPHFLEKLNH